jgi:DNA-binding NarL/FixJ family response regulator
MKKRLPIKIIIADDHEIYRDGLITAFEPEEQYEILATCHDGDQLIRSVPVFNPDIILTDLKMPVVSGVDAIRAIHRQYPQVRCLALSTFDNEFMIVEALEAGAIGYITKSMPKKELFEAVDSVFRNIPYYCKSTSHKLATMIAKSYFNPYTKEKKGLFNDVEKKIIRLICEDKGCQEMAEILFMSYRTVENQRGKIYKKMNVKTTAGVAIYAVKHGLYFIGD